MGLLLQSERHGYDLKAEHDHRFPTARPLAFGQIYAALKRLQKNGFVEAVGTEKADGPERTIYGITDAGRAELNAWLDKIDHPIETVANPFAVKATIALLVADRDVASRYLSRQRAAHLDAMRTFTRIKTDPQRSFSDVLSADYAIAHLDADLRWLDTALERLLTLEQELQND